MKILPKLSKQKLIALKEDTAIKDDDKEVKRFFLSLPTLKAIDDRIDSLQ
jgi:hypothetical protein